MRRALGKDDSSMSQLAARADTLLFKLVSGACGAQGLGIEGVGTRFAGGFNLVCGCRFLVHEFFLRIPGLRNTSPFETSLEGLPDRGYRG